MQASGDTMLGVWSHHGYWSTPVHKKWQGAIWENTGHQHHHLAAPATATVSAVCVWLCTVAQVFPGMLDFPHPNLFLACWYCLFCATYYYWHVCHLFEYWHWTVKPQQSKNTNFLPRIFIKSIYWNIKILRHVLRLPIDQQSYWTHMFLLFYQTFLPTKPN